MQPKEPTEIPARWRGFSSSGEAGIQHPCSRFEGSGENRDLF